MNKQYSYNLAEPPEKSINLMLIKYLNNFSKGFHSQLNYIFKI